VDYDCSEVSFPEPLSFQKPEPPVVEGSALATPERVRTPDCVAVIAASPIPVAVQEEPEIPVPLDLSTTSTAWNRTCSEGPERPKGQLEGANLNAPQLIQLPQVTPPFFYFSTTQNHHPGESTIYLIKILVNASTQTDA
jgi:hypothetical protein